MDIFLNELSLENQFNTIDEFKLSLNEFYLTLDAINNLSIQAHTYYSDNLWYQRAVNGELFSQSISKLSDKSLRTAFINILKNKLNSKSWTISRIHSDSDVYKCIKINVSNSSIAEIAERKNIDKLGKHLLVNFNRSKFSKAKLRVLRVSAFREFVHTASTVDEFGCWAVNNSIITPKYDATSTHPPRDFHTALSDSSKYKRTNNPVVQGRSVYQEISSGRFYYVDNQHCGQSAHIEVYDHLRNHLGKANLDAQLIPGTAENRTF